MKAPRPDSELPASPAPPTSRRPHPRPAPVSTGDMHARTCHLAGCRARRDYRHVSCWLWNI